MNILGERIEAFFIKRLNRFVAAVSIDGIETLVHVPNTGRCKELFIENAKVILEKRNGKKRKYLYELIMVYKGEILISIDSQAPNKIVEEAIRAGTIDSFYYKFIKREQKYNNSRFDIYLWDGEDTFEKSKGCFIEVKGVTLEKDGVAMFPDAPTERGARHLHELIRAKDEGYRAVVVFLIQMNKVRYFVPNEVMDQNFTKALLAASQKGVEIFAFSCDVKENSVSIEKKIEVILNR